MRLKNGILSVMHSSINIPNENVSETAVSGALVSLISSGAKYLTAHPDTLPGVAPSRHLSTIPAIPKL